MPAAKTLRREFLQLAETYKAGGKFKIAGFYVSEKLDGTRCLWDGGLTRGMKTADVPWASLLHPKTGKPKDKIKPFSTGLWSRYGNPIVAPDSFLNSLPACPLDGELWAGRGNFQLCRSICAGDDPDSRFDQISYAAYSSPPLDRLFAGGEIKNANMLVTLDETPVRDFVIGRMADFEGDFRFVSPGLTFEQELLFLRDAIETQNDQCFLHSQTKLPANESEATAYVEQMLERLLEQGAEGVVIRDPSARWTAKRHKGLLKYKPWEDAEAKVIGFRAGKEGKQGNVLGKIGTLIVRTIGLGDVQFEIGSGLTFEDREFELSQDSAWAKANPGEEMPHGASGLKIEIGSIITFKYRELSDDGIPKEGRFWRKRDVE